MQLRKFQQHLRKHGCILHHHGGNHDMWINLQTGAQATVPRHTKLKWGTVLAICKQLGVPAPRSR